MGGEKKGVSIGLSTRSEVIRPNKGPSVWIERVEGTVGGGFKFGGSAKWFVRLSKVSRPVPLFRGCLWPYLEVTVCVRLPCNLFDVRRLGSKTLRTGRVVDERRRRKNDTIRPPLYFLASWDLFFKKKKKNNFLVGPHLLDK